MFASRTALSFLTILGASVVGASILGACHSNETNAASTSSGSGTSTSASSGTGGAGGAGGSGSGTTTTSTAAGGFVPGPHGDAPQVVNAGNGLVLTAPKLQIISWASDPFAPEVDKFVAELAKTSTWAEQTAEYGVGAFTVLPTITLTTAPPAMFDDDSGDPTPFEQNLAAQLSGPSPAWGAADPSTMYMFLLPLGTDISAAGNCCSGFLGYHYEAAVGSGSVPYGVTCHCPMAMGDPLTPLQYVTTTVIHEMVEMATDPYFVSNPAYSGNDDAHFIWTIAAGGEISDMCEYNSDSNYTPPGATYMIQRSWSDAAAKAGKNPCVPAGPAEPYFNAVPVLPDTLSLNYYGQPVKTQAVTIPVGQSKTIDLQLWSDAATSGPWTVTAWDLNDYLGAPKNLDVSLDKSTGKNGDTLKLTIKVLSKDASYGGEGFVIVSDLGGQENMSIGAVGN